MLNWGESSGCFSSLNYPENDVWSIAACTVSPGDDGWIHQPCCLPIKWLYLNTASNLPIWLSSKPQLIDLLYSIFSPSSFIHSPSLPLSHQLVPPPPQPASLDQGALLPERPGSQQALYSEKPHKWSFISITKHRQTGPLFPMALRQTHPVLFWNEKLPVTEM